MPSAAPFFIHPLLSADGAWSGYRLEFSPGEPDFDSLRDIHGEQLSRFDQRHPWLLPAAVAESLAGVFGDRLVAILAAAANGETETLERQLREQHRPVGLQVKAGTPLPAAGAWSYVLIDAALARTYPPYTLLGLSSRSTLIATDVHSHTDRQWLFENGCKLTTGEFLFARPSSQHPDQADLTRMKLLKLLGLIAEDADTGSLEAVFREEAKLSYSLLRLVNSAAVSPRTPITSFAQAINLLGRRQLQRWLQLLVYSDPDHAHQPNPLLQKAALRGCLVELLATGHQPGDADDSGDTAFMVGAFSLLDTLLNLPMQEIIKQLPLPDPAREALLGHTGPYGHLLDIVEAGDRRDLATGSAALSKAGIGAGTFRDAQLQALAWAAGIHSA